MGLLDGDLANIVGSALLEAGLSQPATLVKVTPGTRAPGAITAGVHPARTRHVVQVVPGDVTALRLSGTLIAGVDRVIKIVGSSLPPGVTPAPGDEIEISRRTAVIVGNEGGASAVSVDPAGAMYICQCRS